MARGGALPSVGGRDGFLTSCTSEKVYIVLGIAAIVWIGGLASMIGFGGSAGSLSHPTGPHSHSAELAPHGVRDVHSIQPTNAAPGRTGAPGEIVPTHGRGFGLSKLDQLQQDLKANIHAIFHHADDDYTPPTGTNRYGHKPEQPQVDPQSPPVPPPDAHENHAFHHPASTDDTDAADGLSSAATKPISKGMTSPAILVLTYKRMTYLTRTLDSVVALPTVKNYEVYLSQDGSDPDMHSLVQQYALHQQKVTLFNHKREALMVSDQTGTAYLAQHYKWVLNKLFLEKQHSHVVILEDDMVVSPDFLTLFEETAHLLDTDDTLMCVSSWNDNGMNHLVADATRLLRTDYFPGLGWMMNARMWREISDAFPLDQWDHFMRLDTVSKGRDCLIPEVARNHNIGEEGTNMGSGFYSRYLAPIAFNDQPVSFLKHERTTAAAEAGGATTNAANPPASAASTALARGRRSLEHMRSGAFEREMHATIAQKAKHLGRFGEPAVTQRLSNAMVHAATAPEQDTWLVTYERDQYAALATMFGLLPVPRSIHKGLLSLRLGTAMVYFADIKICPYLPPELKFKRDASLVAKVSRQAESCNEACGRDGLRCSAAHFQFINECSQLKKHFACVKGCRGGVAGEDVPNYVDNPQKQELFGYCLTTEDVSTCGSSHWSASRLCPCVKP